MTLYAYCPQGVIEQEPGNEPSWDNLPESAKEVYFPVVENPPSVEPWQVLTRKHWAGWTVDTKNKTVKATYEITSKPTEQLQAEINTKLQEYIYTKFDIGTQLSFMALYVDDQTPLQVKTAIKTAWTWLQSVMDYYYKTKDSLEVNKGAVCDFEQFDATVPPVKLSDFMKKDKAVEK